MTIAVANSLGIAAWQRLSAAELSVLMQGEDSSGHARAAGSRVADISPEALARTAAQKALASAHPRDLEPGDYPVVLEPEAVADMLMMLGLYDFGALAMQEGRSFLAGSLGQQVCGKNINLWDDGLDPRTQRFAFDFEGVPKQRVDLIRDGVAEGPVWDSYTAHKAGRESTGHALPAPATWGPAPLNMVMAPGDSSLPEMIASLDRGILVTRFHYTNMIHPIKTVFTGMTRDGTFLVEGGKVVGGVKNLRFTQSILEAFETADALTRDRRAVGNGVMAVVPGMRCESFRFSGKTEF
jgi:predicted Zn-dependent protease